MFECSRFQKHPLPNCLMFVLANLRTMDRAMEMSSQRRLLESEFHQLINTRDAVQHRLLSLPAWEDLELVERVNITAGVYNATRIAALIYSNSVIYPQAAASEWHIGLLERIKSLLTRSQINNWPEEMQDLLTWILVVCRLVAYKTKYEAFFEAAWERHVIRNPDLCSVQCVRRVVEGFLWSESACGRGFAIVRW
jgi:hypothetical protein